MVGRNPEQTKHPVRRNPLRPRRRRLQIPFLPSLSSLTLPGKSLRFRILLPQIRHKTRLLPGSRNHPLLMILLLRTLILYRKLQKVFPLKTYLLRTSLPVVFQDRLNCEKLPAMKPMAGSRFVW